MLLNSPVTVPLSHGTINFIIIDPNFSERTDDSKIKLMSKIMAYTYSHRHYIGVFCSSLLWTQYSLCAQLSDDDDTLLIQ